MPAKKITVEPPKYFPPKPKLIIAPKIDPEPVTIAGVEYYKLQEPQGNKRYILVSVYNTQFGKPTVKRKYTKKKRKKIVALENWKR